MKGYCMKCKSIKPDGYQCEANAMSNGYCYIHNPDVSLDEKKEIQARGGKANLITVTEPLQPIIVTKPDDVVNLITDTINKVRAGEMDIRVANCLGVLSGQLIKAIELANTSQRLAIIERVIYKQG